MKREGEDLTRNVMRNKAATMRTVCIWARKDVEEEVEGGEKKKKLYSTEISQIEFH